MSLIIFDGFDYTNTAGLSSRWDFVTGATVSAAAARTGANGLTTGGWVRKNVTNNTQGFLGAAANPQTWSGNKAICSCYNAGTLWGSMRYNAAGQLFVVCQGLTLGPTANQYVFPNQFHYYEFGFQWGIAGNFLTLAATLRADGNVVYTGGGTTGVNIVASYGSNPAFNQVGFGDDTVAANGYIDDVYYCDANGIAPWNNFLGDCFVVASVPSASGSYAQFTPNNANANWQNVKEIPADGLTTYNYTNTVGNRDSFIYPSFPPSGVPAVGQIIGVEVLEYGEADTAGTCGVELTARQSGIDSFSPQVNLGVGFNYQQGVFMTDVNGNPWTVVNLNATEFGYTRSQ